MSRTRFSIRYWVLFAILMVIWQATARLAVPRVIGDAYRGESLPVLNGDGGEELSFRSALEDLFPTE